MRALFILIFAIAANLVHAAPLFFSGFETRTCNTGITDGGTFDGAMWDWWEPPQPYVRCSSPPTGQGANYLENDMPTANPNNAGMEIILSSTVTVTAGETYYLAAFFRFDRKSGLDIWHDTATPYSFDKLFELNGLNTRWGVGSGWSGNFVGSWDHRFTFDAWCAASSFGTCENAPAYYDHKVHNVSPYSSTNPYLASYETWTPVVLAVTMSTSAAVGRVRLWIAGTEVINLAQPTMGSGTVNIGRLIWSGTIAQPAYDAPPHYRRADGLMLTRTYQDIVDGGYMPSGTVAPDVVSVSCSPSTIQAPTTTTCTATLSGGTPDSYAWAAQSCGTPARCTSASTANPATFSCTYGGACTLCLTATNTAGSDTQCATPITVRYVKPSGFGAN